jgi:hypothetical protein|nr:MAG TPA: hypothetical protein [Crassvirales sp.]
MACIIIDGEIQSTFSLKDLEKAIYDILSKDEKQMIISPEGGIGYISRKEYAERSFPKLIEPTQIQENIDKEIINSLHNYKPFSKCLING